MLFPPSTLPPRGVQTPPATAQCATPSRQGFWVVPRSGVGRGVGGGVLGRHAALKLHS